MDRIYFLILEFKISIFFLGNKIVGQIIGQTGLWMEMYGFTNQFLIRSIQDFKLEFYFFNFKF